ncbi:MAG TPA: CRISPR-associated endonuclease Cas3'' [Pirellulales bacterium]|nr:CRISPR-associated endonuclease Cas3'' [Pirellulales bacterium]
MWVIQAGGDDGRLDLGCVLADSPADVADVAGARIRAKGELLEAIENGESLGTIADLSGIDEPTVTPRGNGYVVVQRKRGQSLFTGSTPILLEEHSQAVANLAGSIGERLGLDRQLLSAAGALHDVGKADPRMQTWLGAAPGQWLAKSGHSASAMRNLRPDDLPRSWRHELLSARMLPRESCQVLAHLIASHHGRCRPSPPEHATDGQAAIDFAGLHLQSNSDDMLELEAEAISRFAALTKNPWDAALFESVLVMADRIASRDELTARLVPIDLPRAHGSSPVLSSFQATALNGRTLLGWMAAVGALCVLCEEQPTYLHWDALDRGVFGGWELDEAVAYLAERLKLAPPVCRPKTFEEFEKMGEWGPAVGRWEGGPFKQSPLLGTGAAHTGFDKAWPKLAAAVDHAKVREAIVGPWQYYDKLGQRWDAAEHAEHGSQWGDPSKEGAQSVHGANRLAVEALRLLPTIATGYTIGWNSEAQAITWPLWRGPLTIEGVRAAIRQPMRERWMSRKVSVGQLASFLPAEPCERLSAAEFPVDRSQNISW